MKMLRCDPCGSQYFDERSREPRKMAGDPAPGTHTCGAALRWVDVPDCPCCHAVPEAQSGWPSSKGPRSMLAARDCGSQQRWCDQLYDANWIDHAYRETGASGVVTYFAEPYNPLDAKARADLDYLHLLGYTIEISDGNGKHYPGQTLRIAITPPANETARRRAVLKAADDARRARIAWRPA